MVARQPSKPPLQTSPSTTSTSSHSSFRSDCLYRDLLDYLAKLVDQRMESPKEDLITKLVVEQLRLGHIEKSDAVQIAFLLLVAGNATMVNMINLVRINNDLIFIAF